MPMFAGARCTIEQIRGTIKLLDYYRRFLASDCTRCFNPEQRWPREEMTKDQARRRLRFLTNTSINRKAGVPDVVGRRQTYEYQNTLRRECQQVNDHFNHRRRPWGLNGRRFETDILQKRYGHIFADYEE
jgi:hypothetical protein